MPVRPKLLRQSHWVSLAVVIFIVWKFFLVTLMWQGRSLPPEPDDALIYSGHIYSVARCPQVICNTPYVSLARADGYHYLSYRIIWGTAARLLQLDSITTLRLSFYIGSLLLALTLLFLVRQFTADQRLIGFSLLIMALYFGGGSYHGFYWVVPSFFAVLILLLMIALLHHSSTYNKFYIPLLAVLLVTVHPSGIVFLVIPLIYTFVLNLLTNKLNKAILLKAILALACGVAVYVLVSASLYVIKDNFAASSFQSAPLVQNLTAAYPDSLAITSATSPFIQSQFTHLKNDYFNWVFPHPVAYPTFALVIFLNLYYRQYRVLALFFTSILVVALAHLHPYGIRALIILWPATFMLYSFAFYYGFIFCQTKVRPRWLSRMGQLTIGMVVATFIAANIAFSLAYTLHLNRNDNLTAKKDFIDYLQQTSPPGESVVAVHKITAGLIMNSELVKRPLISKGSTHYFVALKKTPSLSNSPLQSFFSAGLVLFGKKSASVSPSAASQPPQFYEHLPKQWEDDLVIIYKNEP